MSSPLQAQKQVAAALAAALMGVSPAFAADVAPPGAPAAVASTPAVMAPAKEVETKAAPSGGVQNWRYSEFIDAVNKNKVEKVALPLPHSCKTH